MQLGLDVFWVLVVVTASGVSAQATVTSTQAVSLPTARPSDAFNVPADFPSVGFELAFLPGYNNNFSDNLVASLAQRMGVKPVLRIGGTSGDIIKYNPNQTEATHCVKEPCNSAAEFILGLSYFNALKQRFKTAKASIQAPFDPIHGTTPPNRTNVIAYVQNAYNALGADRVDAIALGNEVNWYEPDAASYVKDAQAAKDTINSVLSIGDSPIWEVLDTASEGIKGENPAPYTVKDAFDAGVNTDQKVEYVAEHYYQFDGKTPGIQKYLLNHTDLKVKMGKYKPSIDYTTNTAKARFILSETGGPLGVSDDRQTWFANTLWAVNFQMYAMSMGVSRVSLVQRPEAKRSLWIPSAGLLVPGPRVQAPYYALPFMADFLGKSVSGERGVVNIDLNSPVLSAYTMFEGPTLARIAVVNLREYDGTGNRSAVKVRLNNLGTVSGNKVQVGRLHADAGTAAGGWDMNQKNITWGGQQWSYEADQGKGHGVATKKNIQVTDGSAEVVLPDSEAMIMYLK